MNKEERYIHCLEFIRNFYFIAHVLFFSLIFIFFTTIFIFNLWWLGVFGSILFMIVFGIQYKRVDKKLDKLTGDKLSKEMMGE